jgi:L-lactate dehydrogenase complex protein LldF
MKATSHSFPENAARALADTRLQQALGRARGGFVDKRAAAVAALPEFEALRERAQAIKDHTLAHLDWYLERFEAKVREQGGQVHWVRDTAELQAKVLEICRAAGARRVTKGKSMVGEEAALNEALEGGGLEVTETDLGEYIIQLAKEPPSHIIAPAIHKTREQVDELFHRFHADLDPRPLTEVAELVDEARRVLRDRFIAADVGITGANFLVAETGSAIIVTNEGNGDLTATLPRVHIVTASLEKVVPNLDDAATLLRLLARSATGQEFTSYTTLFTGPRREEDPDGPEAFHIILLDNGRSAMLGGPFSDMLRCIRCGACMNHCPVYGAVGGHAYGWVYPGPMGSVLSPMLAGLEETRHLPEASTLCGRCGEVCPVRIPLPGLLRRLRERNFSEGNTPARWRLGLRLWGAVAARPATASPPVRRPGCWAGSAAAAAPSASSPAPAAGPRPATFPLPRARPS